MRTVYHNNPPTRLGLRGSLVSMSQDKLRKTVIISERIVCLIPPLQEALAGDPYAKMVAVERKLQKTS